MEHIKTELTESMLTTLHALQEAESEIRRHHELIGWMRDTLGRSLWFMVCEGKAHESKWADEQLMRLKREVG